MTTKSKLFKGCRNFKGLEEKHLLKKVYLKYDNPPLTRKEYDRLHQKMRDLRANEHGHNPENIDKIKSDNQLFYQRQAKTIF